MSLGRPLAKRLGMFAAFVAAASLGSAVTVFASDQFSDVPDSHTFHDEIGWLAATGVTQGFPDGTFKPNQSVNRGQMAAFLQRFYNIFGGLHVAKTGTSGGSTSAIDTWQDVSGASVQVTVPPGTHGEIVARLTSEVACNSGDNIFVIVLVGSPRCEMRFLIGSTEMAPGPMTVAESIDAAENPDARVNEVSGTVAAKSGMVGPGTYTIKVQMRANDADGNADDPLLMSVGAWQMEAIALLHDA